MLHYPAGPRSACAVGPDGSDDPGTFGPTFMGSKAQKPDRNVV